MLSALTSDSNMVQTTLMAFLSREIVNPAYSTGGTLDGSAGVDGQVTTEGHQHYLLSIYTHNGL